MAATIVVFENEEERAMKCAGICHDWENQTNIFGTETKKLLDTCDKLFRVSIRLEYGDESELLKKIFGIAKAHGLYVTWYGMSKSSCQPDRFLVSGRGFECLAFIQC